MTLLELIQKYGKGRGVETMWESVAIISDYIEDHKDDDEESYERLKKKVYATMCGKHYNEELGREQIESMYYTDRQGNKHYGPYWTDDAMETVYNSVSNLIPDCYTDWDFYVTLNMLKSDYCNLLTSWMPNASESDIDARLIEMSVAYLNDPDAPHNESKIWCYFN